MGKIIVIPNSDFSRNRIIKVDITEKVEKSVNSQNSTSTVSINNSSFKNNDQ